MYITTFYSFKGGVGRSMALVNAGVELAKRKRRVLLVDFDLEAPGLHTFGALELSEQSLGIVDFVNAYLTSGKSDEIDKYVSECQLGIDGGGLWLMPAGGTKPNYTSQFQQIDWVDLYANQDGFLLIEDLKQQWKDTFEPDYVLIDSRTGSTDVGGICTRQLPDAVAIFYFPNEQNLSGVSRAVKEIRSESNSPRNKEIQLHFIMSNVPDLDDGHQILESKIEEFTSELDFEEEPMTVHRYDSLSLLNQAVFTQTRPNSRLASEYREIVERIVNGNLGDRDGALNLLRQFERRFWNRPWETDSVSYKNREHLEDIEERHGCEGEILHRLGLLYHQEQELERAASLYHRAIGVGIDNPEVYLDRARALADLGSADEASRDAFHALNSDALSIRSIKKAFSLVNSDQLSAVASTNAVVSLNSRQRIRLATQVYFESEAMRTAGRQLIRSLIEVKSPFAPGTRLSNELVRTFISIGEFNRAMELLSVGQEGATDTETVFNFAIAAWGESGMPCKELFEKVIDLHESKPRAEDIKSAHSIQCIALAYWFAERQSEAQEFADKAKLLLHEYVRTFSCWRYLYVNDKEFLQDIGEMKQFFDGDLTAAPPVLANTEAEGTSQ